jgi:hypothetical protein
LASERDPVVSGCAEECGFSDWANTKTERQKKRKSLLMVGSESEVWEWRLAILTGPGMIVVGLAILAGVPRVGISASSFYTWCLRRSRVLNKKAE